MSDGLEHADQHRVWLVGVFYSRWSMQYLPYAFALLVLMLLVGGVLTFCLVRSRSHQEFLKTRAEVNHAIASGVRVTEHRIDL